ncbi:MAG: hypothetical protein FWB77_03675 [Treponema sp.]|nr:hypothetical protein [Treponema sp.]
MKRFFKVLAVTLITVLIAVSCAPAEVEETSYDFNEANKQHDPQNNGEIDFPTVTSSVQYVKNPEISIVFPQQADILRNPSLEELNKFLSFHHYTSPAAGLAATSTLQIAIPYEYVVRYDNTIKVRLLKDFTAEAFYTYSNVIAKFNEQYTYANGLKLDVDRNGTGGEAIYDILYREITVVNSDYRNWVQQENKGWYISLANPSTTFNNSIFYSSASSASTSTDVSFTAAFISLAGVSSTIYPEVYAKVGNMFANNIKLQKLSGQSWVDVATAEYSAGYSTTSMRVTATLEHDTRYRIKWSGSSKIETADEYFGVKQRIYVSGARVLSTARERYSITENVSEIIRMYNPGIENTLLEEITAAPAVEAFPQKINGGDVILKVTFPIQTHGVASLVGLDNTIGLNDFRNCFKIVYRNNGTISDFRTANNLIYAGITNIEYAMEGTIPGTTDKNETYYNVIYITLDSNYLYNNASKNLYFLINDKFKYTAHFVFGNRGAYMYDNFRQYSANLP